MSIILSPVREGVTTQMYKVPNSDETGSGTYTCKVAVSTITSSESTLYLLTAAGYNTYTAGPQMDGDICPPMLVPDLQPCSTV